MDDLISRQQAIDICRAPHMRNADCSDFEMAIMMLPPAQPEPKRGKWIHDGSKWTNRWICSECGYKWFFDCIEGAFCPNCGAGMEVTT